MLRRSGRAAVPFQLVLIVTASPFAAMRSDEEVAPPTETVLAAATESGTLLCEPLSVFAGMLPGEAA